jgi:hypothetical protein
VSRDYDTMTHEVDGDKVIRLRAMYETSAGEKRNRFTKPNVLYHDQGAGG